MANDTSLHRHIIPQITHNSKLILGPDLLLLLVVSYHIDKRYLILLGTSPILSREAKMLGWRVDALWLSESGERMRWTTVCRFPARMEYLGKKRRAGSVQEGRTKIMG